MKTRALIGKERENLHQTARKYWVLCGAVSPL